ncbi:tRNA (guanine-N1)-methyltransferase, putative [Babesia caballi]|uniref:tRNA (Guanine-N1)-methyltransferase, putative n=1 Tax=Babesia caballi TaxID=5871 RepID=A0AAV4LQ29_BABCB|nr:tRNA (guanine-N1)-methyltransferase, putative [Babesia caballi]
MFLLTDYNVLIESLYSHRSECVLAHLQSGCFFESDLHSLFQGKEAVVDRKIKQHLSAPCIFPSLHSVIPAYAPSTALTVCRDSSAGVYHDLETGKCISRISRGVYANHVTDGVPDLGGTCTHLAAAADGGSPLVFLSSALGDINVVDLRVGVKGEFGHPVMCLSRCHGGAISCMYNFRGFSFSLVSGGFEDGKVNFYDLRYPYDHVTSPYGERPMPLRSFEVHLRNQTRYTDMDEADQQILKHMKLGRITCMAVTHDERLMAIANGQSELVLCTTHEDVRVVKMGFLSAKDDYATKLAFGRNDLHLYCATYDLLAGIARCKGYVEGCAADSAVVSAHPYKFVDWPMLNFQSNDWVTFATGDLSYSSDFQLIEDLHPFALFGDREGATHPAASQAGAQSDADGEATASSVTYTPSEAQVTCDAPASMSPSERLPRYKGPAAESRHRSFAKRRIDQLRPLLFTLSGDYAVSTGGGEAATTTVDVWDPVRQQLICSSSTPETRNVRFEHICSGDGGVVLLSGTFERASIASVSPSDYGGHLNKCVCVMKPVSTEAFDSANEAGMLRCAAI